MYQILFGVGLLSSGTILGIVRSVDLLLVYSEQASLQSTDYIAGKTALIFESKKELKGKKRSLLLPIAITIVGFLLMHN